MGRRVPGQKYNEYELGADGDVEMQAAPGPRNQVVPVVDHTGKRKAEGDPDPNGGDDVAIMASSGGVNGPTKETPISRYPSLTYGVQETHTTILPWRGYCSVKATNFEVPQKMEFRMNSIYDIIKHDVAGYTGAQVNGTYPDGIFNFKINNGAPAVIDTNKFIMFPSTIAAGASAAERPQWRDYWAQLYEFYTVLGCKYKITIVNAYDGNGTGDMDFAYEFDSYSQAQGAAGNVMTLGPYNEVRAYKNVKWTTCRSRIGVNANDYTTVISGEYRPGMVKHNIVNDGDIKTWTQISANSGLPTNTDTLVIFAFPNDMGGQVRGSGTSNSASGGCNVRIELDYIVQFKDLKSQARYPSVNTGAGTRQDITNDANDDVRMVPATSNTIFNYTP